MGCEVELAVGTEAVWDAAARTVTCLDCVANRSAKPPTVVQIGRGTAGASAAREYERRKRSREERTRERHPRIGGLPLLGRKARSHLLLYRKQVAKRLVAEGPLGNADITCIAEAIATALPPA